MSNFYNQLENEKQPDDYNSVRWALQNAEGQDSVCGGGIAESDRRRWRWRHNFLEEIMFTLRLVGLCTVRLQSYIPHIETCICKRHGFPGVMVSSLSRRCLWEKLGPGDKGLFVLSQRVWIWCWNLRIWRRWYLHFRKRSLWENCGERSKESKTDGFWSNLNKNWYPALCQRQRMGRKRQFQACCRSLHWQKMAASEGWGIKKNFWW